MNKLPKYLMVETEALPEVFVKVMEAKMLLAAGEVKNSTLAAKAVGISRSAFYKYKDKVSLPASENEMIMTLSITLKDEPGMLSRIMAYVAGHGANILTINQNIPLDGVAPVTISARYDGTKEEMDQMLNGLREMRGVIKIRQLTGR